MLQDTDTRSPQSATHRAYMQLREQIILGEIAPGERLKVETLKLRLETGASPVREALSLLTSDQLVERLDQRGFRVATASRVQFEEILNLRCTLEDLALRESVAAGNQAWEEELVLTHHHLQRADPAADRNRFEERHKAFHMALISFCKSPILLRFCGQLYDLNVRYRYLAGTSRGYSKRDVAAEHVAILEAALDRDVERASACLMTHYRQTGAFLSEMIT
jgi:DNA-binding GntR family transcriptional regulator